MNGFRRPPAEVTAQPTYARGPVRIPIAEGLRALLFMADWVRGPDRFTKTLRVHMIQVTNSDEYNYVLEWECDPIVNHTVTHSGIKRADFLALQKWGKRLLRKYFRKCTEVGRLRKQVKNARHYAELKAEHAAEMAVLQENLTLLRLMYNRLAEQTGVEIDVEAARLLVWDGPENRQTGQKTVVLGDPPPLGWCAACGKTRGTRGCVHVWAGEGK